MIVKLLNNGGYDIDDSLVTYPCEVPTSRIEGKEVCGHYCIAYVLQSELANVGFDVEANNYELGFVFDSENGTDVLKTKPLT